MRKFVIVGLALALGGCAQTAQNAFVAAEVGDSAYLAGLATWEAAGKVVPPKLLADQAAVDGLLAQDEATVKAGGTVTNTSALTAAVGTLTADAVSAGILNPTGVVK